MKVGDVVTVDARRARDGSNNANAQTIVDQHGPAALRRGRLWDR